MSLNAEINERRFNQKENELKKTFEEIKWEANDLKESIKNITPDQLSTIIEKNFKNNEGKWKKYSEIKNSPAYTFIVQMTLDLLDIDDNKITSTRGIDGLYGETTTRLVQELQKRRWIKVDGQAGPKFFEHALQALQPLQQAPTPQPAPKEWTEWWNKKTEQNIQYIKQQIETKEIIECSSFNEFFDSGKHKAIDK